MKNVSFCNIIINITVMSLLVLQRERRFKCYRLFYFNSQMGKKLLETNEKCLQWLILHTKSQDFGSAHETDFLIAAAKIMT